MSEFLVSSRTTIQIASGLSVFCSALLLSCFFLFPKWARTPASFKHVLLVLTVWDMISALNYQMDYKKMHGVCMLQACIMQFFELGSWVYTVMISIDLARGLYQSFRMHSDSQRYLCEFRWHLVLYHFLGIGYGVVTTITFSPLVLNLAGPAGDWCWSDNRMWDLVMYSILWAGFGVIIACSLWIYRMIQLSEQALVLRLTSGGATTKDAGRKRRSWALVRRLTILPLSYILLHVPGTLRRTAVDTGCVWCASETMAYIQGMCDPSQGTVNFLLFGVLDRSLQKESLAWWRRRCPGQRKQQAAAAGSAGGGGESFAAFQRRSSRRTGEDEESDSSSEEESTPEMKWVAMTSPMANPKNST